MATPVLIFLGVGAALLGWSIFDILRVRARHGRWTRVEGVVVGHRTRQTVREGRRRTMYHPIVEFPVGGERWRHESQVSTSAPRHDVGTPLPIVFDPARPDDAVIDAFTVKHFVPLVLGGIGAVFIATAGWLTTQAP